MKPLDLIMTEAIERGKRTRAGQNKVDEEVARLKAEDAARNLDADLAAAVQWIENNLPGIIESAVALGIGQYNLDYSRAGWLLASACRNRIGKQFKVSYQMPAGHAHLTFDGSWPDVGNCDGYKFILEWNE